jgi:MFS transporter, DHA1 family, multidrug resistance protein
MVIPRAIVRDLADGHAAAKLMSQLMLVMGAAPILAPTLGGFVLGFADWHAIFWFGAGYGAICAITVLWKLPDTLPPQNRVKLGPAALLNRNITIGREHSFLTHALLGSFCLAGVFAYLGGSPTVFIGMLHLSPSHYGMVFGLCAAAYIGMAQVNARILPRFGFSAILHVASAVSLLATGTLVVLAFSGPWPAAVYVVPIFVNMGCMGCIVPNATVGALSRHSAHAASASALMGTMQFLMGAISGGLVGIFDNGTAQPMALLMLLGAIGGVVADRLRPREFAEKAIKP